MKHKKIILNLVFAFCSFFLLSGSVSASTKLGVSYDANDHFNYFYEQKNNTPFFNLMKNTSSFRERIHFDNNSQASMIFYYKDINVVSMNSNIDLSDAKYAVFTFNSNPGSIWSSSGDIYTISTIGSSTDKYVTFFDDDAEVITQTRSCTGYSVCNSNIRLKNSIDFDISNNNKEHSENFSYLQSIVYGTQNYISTNANAKYIVTDLYVDDKHYVLEDSTQYSSFLAKVRNFFGFVTGVDDMVSSVDAGLEYYKLYPITKDKKFPNLYTIMEATTDLSIPNGFQEEILDNENTALLFFPKDINNTTLNRYFYTSTNEFVYTDKVSVWLNAYDKVDYSTPYEKTKLQAIKYSAPNKLYKVNVDSALKKVNDSLVSTDYISAFTLQSFKYEPSIYYNPNAYYVCTFKSFGPNESTSSNTCTYENANGDTITLSHDDMYNILSQNDTIGVSSNILDSVDKQCETAKNYSELYEYDDDCNIIGAKNGSGTGGFLATLSDITSWLSGFTGVITTIFSYFGLFFSALPTDIRYCLLFGLSGGTIILIYKLIRG